MTHPIDIHEVVFQALPHAVLVVGADGLIQNVNMAAEALFESGQNVMKRHKLEHYVAFGNPLLSLVNDALERRAQLAEYKLVLDLPRTFAKQHLVDVFVTPLYEASGSVMVMLQGRTMAEKMDQQMVHRSAARSVSGLAEILAHEIKNPLSGIRGAAQLLETSVEGEDVPLTRLIRDETDRIVAMIDQMEVFSDGPVRDMVPMNIHGVLDHVKQLAQNGFGKHVTFIESYDPSLPLVFGNRVQLVQALLNLVKNACEALEGLPYEPTLELMSAFRPGVRMSLPTAQSRVALPLQLTIRDNGTGILPEVQSEIFEPFVTSKTNGKGLGLPLVAKIIMDHGGLVEFESQPKRTEFRILLPIYQENEDK